VLTDLLLSRCMDMIQFERLRNCAKILNVIKQNKPRGTYRLKTEERQRTNEERRRTIENLREITHGNDTETLLKRLGLDFLYGNNFFH